MPLSRLIAAEDDEAAAPHGRVDPALLRQRGVALFLTILVHLLLLLAVLFSRAPELVRKADDALVTFSITPDPARQQAGAKQKSRESETQKAQPEEAAPERQQAIVPKPMVTPPQAPRPTPDSPSFIQLSPSEMAAADIGRVSSRGTSGAAGQGDSRAVAGPGEGPGGVQLFEAEWYREPTNAELAPYLPPDGPRSGWGLVACKTVEQYHVENCQTLGESPLGSGFARAVRQAAWQFLVWPPRVNGKPMIGSWVRIRITYSTHEVRGPDGD